MKRLLFFGAVLCFLFEGTWLSAQTVQYGRVVEMNSKGKTIAGVVVAVPSVPDCRPDTTNAEGLFKLVFTEHHPGDVVLGIHVEKSGYEVVNNSLVYEGLTLDEKDTLKIVLAPEGTVAEARNSYYKYLERACLVHYDSVAKLDGEQAAKDLGLAYKNIYAFTEQLARINQDDMEFDVESVLNSFVSSAGMLLNQFENTKSTYNEADFDFFFKGLDFVENCIFFGDFYQSLEMYDYSLKYYDLALQMYEMLHGYDGADFSIQMRKLQHTMDKIKKKLE